MSESFSRKKSPWVVEPGSPVDLYERTESFKSQTLDGVRASVRTFAKDAGIAYELEEGKNGEISYGVESEHFAPMLGHLKPLLAQANALLAQQQIPVRLLLHMKQGGFVLLFGDIEE